MSNVMSKHYSLALQDKAEDMSIRSILVFENGFSLIDESPSVTELMKSVCFIPDGPYLRVCVFV